MAFIDFLIIQIEAWKPSGGHFVPAVRQHTPPISKNKVVIIEIDMTFFHCILIIWLKFKLSSNRFSSRFFFSDRTDLLFEAFQISTPSSSSCLLCR